MQILSRQILPLGQSPLVRQSTHCPVVTSQRPKLQSASPAQPLLLPELPGFGSGFVSPLDSESGAGASLQAPSRQTSPSGHWVSVRQSTHTDLRRSQVMPAGQSLVDEQVSVSFTTQSPLSHSKVEKIDKNLVWGDINWKEIEKSKNISIKI